MLNGLIVEAFSLDGAACSTKLTVPTINQVYIYIYMSHWTIRGRGGKPIDKDILHLSSS